MSQPAVPAPDTESHATSFLLEHLAPAAIWLVLLFAKATTLIRGISQISGSGGMSISDALQVTQQILTLIFTGLIVTLFLTRRPVIGRRAPWLNRIVAIVGSFVLYVPAAAPTRDGPPALVALSSALILAGLVLSIVSLRTLDKCFGMFPEARGLVTSGPYHYVRHPLYLGEIVTGLGLVLGTAWTPVIGLFIALCVFQVWRAYLEERALSDVFADYPTYQRGTWRIIPYVY